MPESGSVARKSPPCGPSMWNFIAAELQCNPHYRDWNQGAFCDAFIADVDVSTLHVYGDAVVPCSTYEIQIIPEVSLARTPSDTILAFRWV